MCAHRLHVRLIMRLRTVHVHDCCIILAHNPKHTRTACLEARAFAVGHSTKAAAQLQCPPPPTLADAAHYRREGAREPLASAQQAAHFMASGSTVPRVQIQSRSTRPRSPTRTPSHSTIVEATQPAKGSPVALDFTLLSNLV